MSDEPDIPEGLEDLDDLEGADRRRAQRIHLPEEPSASFDGVPVAVLELGLVGVRISTDRVFPEGHFGELVFQWQGEDVRARCRVANIMLQSRLSEAVGELIYHLGLDITKIDAASQSSLQALIGRRVAEALAKQRANALGEPSQWDQVIEQTKKPAASTGITGYTSCRLLPNGQWRSATIIKALQPRDGFTVRASASDDEIEQLKKAYESGSAEERDMIRICAELSLIDDADESLPPQRFEP
jgi:hypothetical protein